MRFKSNFALTSATDMFTIHRIENSSFVYLKHVFLDISIKGRFESNKCLLFIKSKTHFIQKFFLYIFKKKISKKIFSKSVITIVYKDYLKPLSLFDVIFSGAIIPLVSDKRERLLSHTVFALWHTLSINLLLEL